jgi:hypothetical protein
MSEVPLCVMSMANGAPPSPCIAQSGLKSGLSLRFCG